MCECAIIELNYRVRAAQAPIQDWPQQSCRAEILLEKIWGDNMGVLECASYMSVSRGYDYYQKKKVICVSETAAGIYSAKVAGSANRHYSVELHADHPRKSKCNCPHADGRRIVCKHIVATFFTVFPEEAERYYAEVIAWQEEAERRAEEIYEKVCKHVQQMKKAELQQALLQVLFDGPEWQYDRFVREYGLDDD